MISFTLFMQHIQNELVGLEVALLSPSPKNIIKNKILFLKQILLNSIKFLFFKVSFAKYKISSP